MTHLCKCGHVTEDERCDVCEIEYLRAEVERLRGIIAKLNVLDIAAIEAFCHGVQTGQPTREQIGALLDAAGGIRRLLRQGGEEVCPPLGQGQTTAAYLRRLAEECEHEAAEAAKEKK